MKPRTPKINIFTTVTLIFTFHSLVDTKYKFISFHNTGI